MTTLRKPSSIRRQRVQLSRRDAVNVVRRQLNGDSPAAMRKSCWHYGKVELRELLDAIYGGPPTRKDQYLTDAGGVG